jgi:hypothetical protein
MNAKRKGNRQEHQSKAILEAAGYAVTRAAGSRAEGCAPCRGVERALHRMLGRTGHFNGEWFPPAAAPCLDSFSDRWGTV